MPAPTGCAIVSGGGTRVEKEEHPRGGAGGTQVLNGDPLKSSCVER